MERLGGLIERIALAMAGKRSPWGKGPSSGDDDDGGGEKPAADDQPKGPRNPWLPGSGGDEERRRRSASIEDIFRHRRPDGPRRDGGGGIHLPQAPGGFSWFAIALAALVLLWLGLTSIHQVGPKEEGIVTTFGKYTRTLSPGLNYTFPWPFQHVDIENVSEFRIEQIPQGSDQRLMLTGDQNLVDLSYVVRWNIKDLKLFRFQLLNPEDTVIQVAEAAMRSSVAEESLNSIFSGAGRADTENAVKTRMQDVLDAYRSGIAIQGVQIKKTDPPAEVEDAFKDVSAAQQDAESTVNQAEAIAQQVLARAQGDATSFDKVYAQYRLAPEVTRRRMYYETMERVLSKTDKVIVEAPGVNSYLPLPQIKPRPGDAGAAGQGQGQ
ncbi:MAG TPA: FtsH protease activity modulator HflK [Croceibacterium sp.]|jgi:membrane protease subunit HflK|nr:FtsH protease activity modulator HflK [Croceibacterium sp.]